MNHVAPPICQRPGRRSWPTWVCFAFGTITANIQETEPGSGVHIAIAKRLADAIDTRSAASIDSHPITGTIQIAIAGGTA
ncbi:hypothetical protein F2P44_33790 [Massilia sp. CCM 8695]|uniref:Uncharacterized protein n=2 Tax=Massilia TaxID=149698 RepID=A0ABX0N2X5_9BURK|nr:MULTISPECIES: hypothetical protein [Massilia]NHZ66988.1 hypothetical protein [Massilia genomosp. 1]NHZ84182.1 hypothetical protein [Massilia frigida]